MDEPTIAAADPSAAHARLRRLHALLFYPVLVFAGLTNSFFVADSGLYRFLFPGSVLCLVLYFAYLLRISTPFLRMLWLIGMFMCAFGENFLVYALDMYNFSPTLHPPYAIPPYVILGHGYALWTAYVIGDWLSTGLGARRALGLAIAVGVLLFVGRLVAYRDVWGASWIVFAALIFLGTPRAEHRLFYACTFSLCTLLEIIGVALHGWDWHASTYYLDTRAWPMANPPAAVGAVYVTGDFLTLLLMRKFGLDDHA